ncbi:hypothetical protein Btru_021303 [Bulinus truncatus]|nr:hypothetical protein Btru_021303 [Bulinus truncatus]
MTFIYLLIFISHLRNCVGEQLCQSDMTYHKHSHSCIIVVTKYMPYAQAKDECRNYKPNGHLLYILDKETDKFVKENFLKPGEWPFIGLLYNETEQCFKWGNEHKASYIGWFQARKPDESKPFYITKNGWEQFVRNESSNFICQTIPKINETMFLNVSNFDNVTLETLRGSTNLLECRSHSLTETHLELLLTNERGQSTIKRTDTHEIQHKFKSKCMTSGLYVCIFMDSTGLEIRRLQGLLRVKCEPNYCSEQDKPEIKVPSIDKQNVTLQVCVVAYPKPRSYKLYSESQRKFVGSSRYDISLEYNSNISTRGQMNITFYKLSQTDIGRYIIQVQQDQLGLSNLTLIITGPPQCPRNISYRNLSHNRFTLTWSPLHNGITQQTFVIVKQEAGLEAEVAQISDAKSDVIKLNITGLSASIHYRFYIKVSNEHGTTTCKQHMIDVITKESSDFDHIELESDKNIAMFVAPPLTLFIVLTTGIIVLFVLLKTQKAGSNSEPTTLDTNHAVGSSQGTVTVNINLAASAINKCKSDKKTSRNSVSNKSGTNDVIRICHNPSINAEKAPETEASQVYSNQSESKSQSMVRPAAESHERKISPDGLIYVSLEITSSGQTSRPMDKENKKAKTVYEPVEYTTLDYRATAEAAVNQSMKEK